MASSLKLRELKDFKFRPLSKPDEFREAEEVQKEAWGLETEPPVPAPALRAAQDNGGLVLGAFVDIHLAGFAFAFLGREGTNLFLYSHMTAVRPVYQNHRIGFRLKEMQRVEALRQGLTEVRWTYDPLRSRNAFLNIRRLGARATVYLVNYYGRMGNEENRDIDSDRLRVRWPLTDPRTEARVAGQLPLPQDDYKRWQGADRIIETELAESGLRIPAAVQEPSQPEATIEIPFDFASVREHEPESLGRWRHATRDAFRLAFDTGFEVDDFAVVTEGHERRSIYFLVKSGASTTH